MVPRILFVCLGNICCAPPAKAAFRAPAPRIADVLFHVVSNHAIEDAFDFYGGKYGSQLVPHCRLRHDWDRIGGDGNNGIGNYQTASVQQMVIDPDAAPVAQRVKVGTICLFSGPPLSFGSSERTLNTERYERMFNSTLMDLQFAVVQKSADMFEGQSKAPEPDFLVAGKLHPTEVNICDSVDGIKGLISLSIEWQVFDRSKREVVESVVTQGSGQLPKFDADGLKKISMQRISRM